MLWSIFMLLIILDLCNSTAIVNSVLVNEVPQIYCRDGSMIVQRAITIHKIRSLATYGAAATGQGDPAYKAIFKSNARMQDIFARWYALLEFRGRRGERRPTFMCVYSEYEARQIWPTSPHIWESCSKPMTGGLTAIKEMIIVCPPFFTTRTAESKPRPQLCPDVNNNEFVISPDGHEFPFDQSLAITSTMLLYYLAQINTTYERPENIIELYNEILRRNNEANAPEFTSNLLFQKLVWNECRNIPDVDLPPWTIPANLYASLAGNVTSNSDTANNSTGHPTLALDDPQPLNLSGSLLQGISPNVLGTS